MKVCIWLKGLDNYPMEVYTGVSWLECNYFLDEEDYSDYCAVLHYKDKPPVKVSVGERYYFTASQE